MKVGITLVLVYMGLIIASLVGWVLNIVAIVHALHEPISAMFVARLFGVVAAPLGAVLGYF